MAACLALAPLCPNSAPFPFPGTIHRGTCSISFPTQPLKSRSQICLAEPGALSVKTAASGRRWQPPPGKRGNLEDSFRASLPCREMHRASLPKLSQKVVSVASESTHGLLSPVRWTQTTCELQSLWCSGLYCLFCICHPAPKASMPLASPRPSLHCICSLVPGTRLSFPPSSFTRHTYTHTHVPPHTVL